MNKEKLKQEIDKKGIFFEEYEYDLLYDIIKKTDKQELREHYAGLAMQGLLASDTNNMWSYIEVAKMAVTQADLLIEQLNKDKEDGR